MNNLLKIIVLLFASIILFGSCKTVSVTKRHYNKGFYVSHSHKMKTPGKADNKNPGGTTRKKTEPVESLVVKETKASVSDEKEITSSDMDAGLVAPKASKKLFKSKPVNVSSDNVELAQVVKRPWKAGKAMAAKAAEDDALSLLWILIVALLIIYIVGILLDGFGLGGIIHILGVIVLVLLILWLLKLI